MHGLMWIFAHSLWLYKANTYTRRSSLYTMTIPLILASKSKPRRDILFHAGICPTIRVSHVDEDAVLARTAQEHGITVDGLPIDTKVMLLAEAKALAVYEAYLAVAKTAREATGEHVTGRPLDAVAADDPAAALADDTRAETQTRDFSRVRIPRTEEPLQQALAAEGRGLTAAGVGPLILGCDSMFLLDGKAYGKPHTPEVARARLRWMSGATGELWTGHCLIDFATGRVSKGASKATLHFSEFSDTMINRYIATGEPLEVAGSFTLDGFGGAFIEGIEGDPSGIIGLSLPLARQLTEQLGVEWTDLWNVTRDERFEVAAPNNGGKLPPKENVRQPGDGWVECACGRKHWGTNGAAGVLLARRDAQTGEVTHIVMQHRAAWSAEGGTWGIPGGAIADGENTIEGALRESFEEANITPEDIEVVGSYCEDHGPWSYTTVFAFEKPGHEVHPKANDDESMEIVWVPIDEVPDRKLLTAMRTDWPSFEKRLRALAVEHKGE
ncbi:septum formation inhibitor Maf [Bifidobacterium pseudolongum subsp. globosum]|uniref:Nucleoside triphosphate pyrophosphatase n=2 Tax=Bifidobacterium pseudolongum TaxID=1694 RepID=A0AB37WZY7_9BIFI|nr:septum formation inhibitor Maf [Bifidobacterium pseudolongum subsp. globosum]